MKVLVAKYSQYRNKKKTLCIFGLVKNRWDKIVSKSEQQVMKVHWGVQTFRIYI
jgi:hypothetical protein